MNVVDDQTLDAEHAEILSREDARIAAMRDGDADSLIDLLSEDLLFIHSIGFGEGKDSYIQSVRSSSVLYHGITTSNRTVTRVDQNAALIFSEARVQVAVNGKDLELNNLMSSLWRRESGGWRAVLVQSTAKRPAA